MVLLSGAFAMSGSPGALSGQTLAYSSRFTEALLAITGGAELKPNVVKLELPEVAENGSFVPITISTESPMTTADHVRAIDILSTANPVARIATFHLSPVNGRARVQSRIRLAETQDVFAIVSFSDGSFAGASLPVTVEIGGCRG